MGTLGGHSVLPETQYGTPYSKRLRALIRDGVIQAPSPMFDVAVAAIYESERQMESLSHDLEVSGRAAQQ